MLKPGDQAPDFTLSTDKGEKVQLSKLRDRPVVLFFYPKDDTPGCTIECKEFRDAREQYLNRAHVFGISADDVASHQAFVEKFSLNFPLLADVGHHTADAFGVWGNTAWGEGIHRTTFVIGTDGHVANVFEKVRPQGHAAEVLAALPK